MKDILIVIDYQNDFITGSLYNEDAINILSNVVDKIKSAISSNKHIIFTRDTHYENYLDTMEGRNLPIKHCIKGTPGWEIRKECLDLVSNYDNITFLDKPTFGYKDWNKEDISDMDNIELIGVCTDICVVSNAIILKSYYPNSIITVDSNCCAGLSKELHNQALDVMKSCQIKVI